MIIGTVNAKRQPIVQLVIRGPAGREETVEALVDTGFNGALMLPEDLIVALRLTQSRSVTIHLADGSSADVAVYQASAMWNGIERRTRVLAGGTQHLLGMSLVLGHKLCVSMIDGGAVAIALL